MLGIDAIHAACEYDVHTHQAATDTPVCARLEQLLKRYPNALFILTTRELDPWLDSISYHMANSNLVSRSFREREYRQCRQKLYGSVNFNAYYYEQGFKNYHGLVDSLFTGSESQLLRYPLVDGAGWGPLCEFLGMPVPGWEFPIENVAQQKTTPAPRGGDCS